MRPSPRVLAVVCSTALVTALGVATSPPASAATPLFGYGTPTFTASAADVQVPLTPLLVGSPDNAGEPSIGIDQLTGAAMFMSGWNVLRATFDPTSSKVTWADASPFGGTAQNEDPILATDPSTGTTLAGGDDTACSGLFRSTDDGGSWLPSVPCTVMYDHPTVAWAPSATDHTKHVWYYCQQGPDVHNCAASTDDGTTWLPGTTTGLLTCIGIHGHLRGSADGYAYLPGKSCFDANANLVVGGEYTHDDGATWTEYTIPGATESAFDPAAGVAPDGTLYEAWENGSDSHPLIASSSDHGTTWSTPTDLASTVSPPLVASSFPTLVTGDTGRLAYSFLGTSVGSGNPNTSGFVGVWYAYTSYSYDGGKTWTTVRDTATPVQVGEIDSGGTTTTGQRNLLDFIDSTTTKDGRVVVAFADGCLADCEAKVTSGDLTGAMALSTHAWASLAWQSSGRGLLSAYDVNPPAAPVVTGTTSGSSAQLSWAAPSSGGSPITGYQVLRSTTSGAETSLASTTGTSYTDSGLTAGQTYFYKVVAVNAVGSSPASNEISLTTGAPPAAPALTATPSTNAVAVAWSTPADGGSPVTGYVLKRGSVSGAETTLTTLTATSFTDRNVTPGAQYFYTVQAVNAVGTSASSAEASATPYTTASAPTLTGLAGKGQSTLSWTIPGDGGRPITGYAIYRGSVSGAETLVQTISSGTTYVDPGLTGGTTYFYRVAAITVAGAGALSNEVAVVPKKG